MSRLTSAFTLIEMLIAIALGTAICYTAFAGIRMASQATATTRRLSTENTVLRLALQEGMDELDFWTRYDDPNDPSRQPLRSPGRPFAPLSFDREDLQLDFTHADPRTWWRGAIYSHFSKRLGDYGNFSSLGDASAERRWYGMMLTTIFWNLGSVALIEYMPGNAIYSCSDDAHNSPWWLSNPGWGNWRFIGQWYSNRRPRGQIALLHNCGYCITLNPAYDGEVSRSVFAGSTGDQWNDGNLYGAQTATDLPFMTIRPEHIPDVSIKISHFYDFGPRPYHIANIAMTSPLTGKVTTLGLALTTTTLRGARRQRGLDQGSFTP